VVIQALTRLVIKWWSGCGWWPASRLQPDHSARRGSRRAKRADHHL